MPIPRCVALPLPDHQVRFEIEGRERLRWHYGKSYPRPFFYPFMGPASGSSLTRMGHPGAPDHDHHRSIWFAHEKVDGVNYWSDKTPARVEQQEWLCYQDSDEAALMAVKLAWRPSAETMPVMTQELIVAIRPGSDGETFLELQSTFRPTGAKLTLGKTNFGFLAVRMAKGLSLVFGNGRLTNSLGCEGEPAIFGKPAEWVDYSGEQQAGQPEGITYFDHPKNPGHPAHWHVRSDGWMGASACFTGDRIITPNEPLTLRYQLHAHRGMLNSRTAIAQQKRFAALPNWKLIKAPRGHIHWGIRREGA